MKTIEEALNIAYDECKSNAYFGNGFKKGVEFAQQYTNVEDKLPDANIQDDEGIFYSEYLLIKVKGLNILLLDTM